MTVLQHIGQSSQWAKIYKLKFELHEHPPYLPDLAPSDYHLFHNLKKVSEQRRGN